MDKKSAWKTPKVVEIPVGLEIGAYAPPEIDRERLVKRPPPRE
ncbi:MAG: pyrroloquinoline quinone precursor peptide PqqA [Polyangiaceae bacterium]|nr:pyrroloquinoline quinone precursor peptide PqqA [Polyangiaceae bacterium]